MRIVVAMDSFKGSLTSMQAGNAIKSAAMRLSAEHELFVFPLADGGEGTVAALCDGLHGQMVEIPVTGPKFNTVQARYCIVKDTAVIEMASAAGITLLLENECDPMETTTYGVGQLIKDAIERGCRHFVIGIGGSATNDGGIGMLTALGYRFLDADGNPVPACGKGLGQLHSICRDGVLRQLQECTFRVACDVNNPLCGENGCSAVYGPQKGATPDTILKMDAWLENYAKLASQVSSSADMHYPGAGAAGGLGFAFLSFTNAVLEPGVNIIMDEIGLEERIAEADLVITGEGRLDFQSVMGKTPVGVASMAQKYGKPVIALVGCIGENAEICNDYGIDAFFPIVRTITTLNEVLDTENAYKNLEATAYQLLRLIDTFRK